MRPCFAFTNIAAASAETPAVLSIFDEIGFWGVQAKDFRDSLEKVKAKAKEVHVEINSPGGDVFAGVAIYQMLKASGMNVVVKVMGVAASAASLIAMAGDKIVMPKNTFMMIHNPWSFAVGNAEELRETAATLDKIGSSLRATYAARTGLPDKDLDALLAKDTWLTADEAKEKGFADEVIEDIKASAKFDMDRAELPDNVKKVFAAAPRAEVDPDPEPEDAPEDDGGEGNTPDAEPMAEQVAAYAKSIGMEEFGAVWALGCKTLDEAKVRGAAAREIKALCVVAKKPDAAAVAIKANKSVDEVRAELVQLMAREDEASHTSGAKPQAKNSGQSDGAAPPVSSQTIWESHNKQSNRKE